MQTFEARINSIRYRGLVQGEGVPVLLLHGFTGSARNWTSLMGALAGNYQVLAVDLLGHGETDSPPEASRYRIEQAAADIAALLLHLGCAPAHLLGYSMGGRLALCLALTYPALFRSLVLESASPGLRTEAERAARRASDHALADQIEDEGVAAFTAAWARLPLFASQARLPQQARDRLHQQRLGNDPRGLANSLRGMGTGEQPSLWPRLGEWDKPTLLMAGADDVKYTQIARAMAEAMPTAQARVMADAGHTVHLEQRAAFTAAVAAFLAMVP